MFVHLVWKLPAYEKAEWKGDVTTWKCAMCATDAYIWIIEQMEAK